MTGSTKVFISHTQDDVRFARELSKALVARGIDATGAWGLAPGKSIEEQLQQALGAATMYVVLLSDRTLLSPWVYFEVGAAIGGRKRLVLVYLSERARLEVPAPLRRSLTIEATSLRPEEVADRVVEAAKAA